MRSPGACIRDLDHRVRHRVGMVRTGVWLAAGRSIRILAPPLRRQHARHYGAAPPRRGRLVTGVTHRVWTETCPGCNPWTRVVLNPATNAPIVQALHEDSCFVWPRLHRTNGLIDG